MFLNAVIIGRFNLSKSGSTTAVVELVLQVGLLNRLRLELLEVIDSLGPVSVLLLLSLISISELISILSEAVEVSGICEDVL